MLFMALLMPILQILIIAFIIFYVIPWFICDKMGLRPLCDIGSSVFGFFTDMIGKIL